MKKISAATKPTAVGYVRVSLAKQAEKGGSLAVQQDRIIEYAVLNGFDLVEVFEDAGVSGAKGDDERPGLRAALDAIRAGTTKTLIVADADRLARDTNEAGYIRTVVKRAKGRLIVLSEVNEGVEVVAVRQLLAVLEREKIRSRMRVWAKARKAQGLRMGPAPYGSTPEEQATIDRFKAIRAEGLSLRAATAKLNAEGYVARCGRPWQMQGLARSLSAKA
jgi:DNA invertase Pin-like site-specific DNA recombinase